MLKKVMAIGLALSMLLCLAACSKQPASVETTTSQSSAPEPSPTPDPRTMPEYHSTDAVRERGVLTISVNGSAKLIYPIPDDPETYGELAGTWAGYIPELCRRIAEELGVEAEFVTYDTLEEELQAVVDGEVEFAAGNFVINEERLAIYEMTDRFDVWEEAGDEVFLSTHPLPWPERDEKEKEAGSVSASASASAAEPEPREMIQSEEDLHNARIGVLKGSVQVKNVAAQYPGAELHELPTNAAILEAAIAGEVDACVFTTFDRDFADQIVQAILDGDVAQCDYRVAVTDSLGNGFILMKGNEDLCQSINAIIAQLMQSGWLNECYEAEMVKASERGII